MSFSLYYRRTIVVLLSLFFSLTGIVCQNTSDLAIVDSSLASLLRIVDENKYTYEHQLWLESALNVVKKTDYDVLSSYQPQVLKKLEVDGTIVFYCLRPEGMRASLTWLARRCDKDSGENLVFAFTDVIQVPTEIKVKPGVLPQKGWQVRTAIVRDLIGLEITDTLSSERIWWMPDMRLRLGMEALSDIYCADDVKSAQEVVVKARLGDLLSYGDAMDVNLSGLPRLYSLSTSDKVMRIVTYMNVFSNLNSRCFGFVLRRNPNGTIDRFELQDESIDMRSPETKKLTSDKWFGAVYYDLIECKFDKKIYYTLLGYHGNDGMVKTRVVDVLWFDNRRCRFGAPVFEHTKATYCRRIFRYSAGVNMMLRFDEQRKSLVFDHLAPGNSMYLGEYAFYGPDFSYDSYLKTKNYWEFHEDVDLRQQ